LPDPVANTPHSWAESLSVYRKPKVLALLFLGFSAGLPFLLVFATLITWLKTAKLDIAIIGYFSWIGITYSIKIFWAPFVDKWHTPFHKLGHRRGWMLLAQVGIATGLILMSLTNPLDHPYEMACFALLVAFSSATQDISIDAYRIEAAAPEYQAAMASMYILGYRLAVLTSGAGALFLAEDLSWSASYMIMAACVSVGMITVFLLREPEARDQERQIMPRQLVVGHFQTITRSLKSPLLQQGFKVFSVLGLGIFLLFFQVILLVFFIIFPVAVGNAILGLVFDARLFDTEQLFIHYNTLLTALTTIAIVSTAVVLARQKHEPFKTLSDWTMGAVIGPFVDFFYRFGIIIAVMVLALIAIYRISDIFMASMAYALYVDLGFDLKEIASITKVFGFVMTIIGAALGGILVMRYGVMRPLLVGAVMVAITTLLFALLATKGESIVWLAIVIMGDNISAGLAQSAFIAYLSALVNKSYTATQYALFSSLMTLLGKFLSGFSGEIVKADGYVYFFIYASIIGIPTILLIIALMMKKHVPEQVQRSS